jgi:MOSC domain-containing protein YiiM
LAPLERAGRSRDALTELGGVPAGPAAVEPDDVIDQLDAEALRLARLGGTEPDILALAVHDATHHLLDLSRDLHALGAPPGAGAATGVVVQVNVSPGGVPKLPVASARVGRRGLDGDRQKVRRHHGRPWQALCLWSAEVIDRLAAEGHPIGRGSAGENLTIAGIDWASIRPGIRMQVGTALIETSLWALPCKQTAAWFTGGEFARMHHERERGVSRIYAWVLGEGEVAAGDPVVVEP